MNEESGGQPSRPPFYRHSVSETLGFVLECLYPHERTKYWEEKVGPEADELFHTAADIASELGSQGLSLYGLGISDWLRPIGPDNDVSEDSLAGSTEGYCQRVIDAECQWLISIPRVREALLKIPEAKRSDLTEMVRDVVQHDLGGAAVNLLEIAEDRIWHLIELSRRMSLGECARSFLRRAARLYLWGFDVECTVFCRSVLDAEFEGNVPTDDCVKTRDQRKSGRPVDLCDRIEVAAKLGRITHNTMVAATKLRVEGNKLLHGGAKPTLEALGVIETTLCVISELARPAGRQ